MSQTKLTADFSFPDGIYLSHAAVLAVQPDLGWEAINGEMVQLPEAYRVQIEGYQYKDATLDPGMMPYAIGLDGELYLFVQRNVARNFYEFTGLRLVGTLSTIAFDTVVTTRQLMKAYNPANGYAFREAWVEREKNVVMHKVLHFPSGRLFRKEQESLMVSMSEDKELSQALRELPEVTDEYLDRAVRLYNERYPTLLRPE
ncbi:hypothetical protein A3850_017510 [Lewinella sp. 4G2]|nr:hypothetical protein A3850_017510 [Lewinella sp. 4G2]